MRSVRVVFKKFASSVYISHLDMNRFMTRAVRLAKIPIWYTEGFNPHPYITFAQPLSLGFQSDCEILDMKIEDDSFSNEQIRQNLAKVMPEGIKIMDVIDNNRDSKEICFAVFTLAIKFEDINSDKVIEKLQTLFKSDSILVKKKTKKGVNDFDIKPHLNHLDFLSVKDSVQLNVMLPSSVKLSVNPTLIIKAIEEHTDLKIDDYTVQKMSILDENQENFIVN